MFVDACWRCFLDLRLQAWRLGLRAQLQVWVVFLSRGASKSQFATSRYRGYIGLYRDTGKENGNNRDYRGYIRIIGYYILGYIIGVILG